MTKPQLFAMFIAMIVTSALVSAATVFGAAWYLKQAGDDRSMIEDTPLSFLTQDNQGSQGPSFQSLDKVVLSVRGKKQTHFVMIELAVETRRPDRLQNINDYMPIVRNAMLNLFSQKTYEDLHGEQALASLQDEVKNTVMMAFAKTEVIRDIDDVLLTKYVVQ
ncbi:flagellar basal body-associated FliL family protein [Vibrio mediterranei]|uniref:Flagellar protein FliL n=1 Tax=Vibrio mediterranei TaxID=689 RepID=A0AAN1KMN9_9VIBR|nr:flagellar basal body-associated FliL family protein [Vibrio mediterranei]ASI89532.1 flagellar protein [Vibrio mediterranei]MCG9656603.1 flagellar basal body-associated FliL family protein [Vibrio mediterranei]MCY9854607.1 flagellar basal body-associated FliL family protein [Vibrio mediterranei]